MSKKLLQRFLIFFFSWTFLIILVVGWVRTKRQGGTVQVSLVSSQSTSTAPTKPSTVPSTPSVTPPASPSQNTPKSTAPKPPSTPTPPPAPAPTQQTFTGSTYSIPWGNVTVSVTTDGGKIVAVDTPDIPNSPPSRYAQPILIQQALQAGSANIQGVSGATYTSLAFQKSLENAIAQAGL